MTDHPSRRTTLRRRLSIAFIALGVATTVLFGSINYLMSRQQMRQGLDDRLKLIVAAAAMQVDGDLHSALQPGDDGAGPVSRQLQDVLLQVQALDPDIAYIYTMRKSPEGEIQFFIDPSDPDIALGSLYEDPGPLLVDQFDRLNKPLTEQGFYTDEYGTWLSGYAPIYTSSGELEAVIGVDISAETVIARERTLLLIFLGGMLLVSLAAAGCGFLMAHVITRPVLALSRNAEELNTRHLPALIHTLQAVAGGDLNAAFTLDIQPLAIGGHDEIGSLTQLFNQLTANLAETGQALGEMTRQLSELIRQAAGTADLVSQASGQIAGGAELAGVRIGQISQRMEGVAKSTGTQTASIQRSQVSIDQLAGAVGEVAAGAREQTQAIDKVSTYTSEIASAIQRVVGSTQAVTDSARQAAKIACQGEEMVHSTIQEMESLKQTVSLSGQKVSEMGSRSDQIGQIAETIKDIASQTNLLALNTYIETARVDSQSHALIEGMLDRQMITQASLINHILEERQGVIPPGFWEGLAAKAKLDTICITDAAGLIVMCNEPTLIGWKFSEDPKSQTYPFLALIQRRDGVVCQKAQQRGADKKVFKYVGVSRTDQPGIVQVGYELESLAQFQLRIGGLAVVADEVRKLADRSGKATREIAALTRDIQSTVLVAVKAMDSGMQEVEAGVARAVQTGSALEGILGAIESVNQQALQASQAARQVEQTTTGLVQQIDAVAVVIDQNSQVTQKMASDSGAVRGAFELIASASQENQAAVDEVNASTGEMSGLMGEFVTAAHTLEEKVAALRQQIGWFQVEAEPSALARREKAGQFSKLPQREF